MGGGGGRLGRSPHDAISALIKETPENSLALSAM